MPRQCRVDGCDRPHYALNACRLHYDRLRRTGSTDLPPPSYKVAHRRMSNIDPAERHACVDCGRGAREWSYNGGDPAQLIENGLAYSVDKKYYSPRCVRCHRLRDWQPKFPVEEIRKALATGETQTSIARRLGCSQQYVSYVKHGG